MGELTAEQQSELRKALGRLEKDLKQAIEDAGENTRPVELDSPIGRVTRIESELEELSRFARVVVTLLPHDIPKQLHEKVIPGLFVDVSIMSQQLAQVTSMPRAILRQGNIIWTVDNNNHLQFVTPDIVYKSNEEILVRNLAHGTQVVMSNLEIVTEGMQVRIIEGS